MHRTLCVSVPNMCPLSRYFIQVSYNTCPWFSEWAMREEALAIEVAWFTLQQISYFKMLFATDQLKWLKRIFPASGWYAGSKQGFSMLFSIAVALTVSIAFALPSSIPSLKLSDIENKVWTSCHSFSSAVVLVFCRYILSSMWLSLHCGYSLLFPC